MFDRLRSWLAGSPAGAARDSDPPPPEKPSKPAAKRKVEVASEPDVAPAPLDPDRERREKQASKLLREAEQRAQRAEERAKRAEAARAEIEASAKGALSRVGEANERAKRAELALKRDAEARARGGKARRGKGDGGEAKLRGAEERARSQTRRAEDAERQLLEVSQKERELAARCRELSARADDLESRARSAETRAVEAERVALLKDVSEGGAGRGRPRTTLEVYFSPGDECLLAIRRQLEQAQRSIDICVFTITDDRIAASILEAHARGVTVRVVTDNDKALDEGSDIRRIERAGIEVREDRTEFHMHHKFALFDGKVVLTGSYNWTRGAARNNEENLVVSSDPRLIGPFEREFQALWTRLSRD